MKLSDININLPQSGNIDERVNNYLLGVGDNKELAEGLKKTKRFWIGPLILPLGMSKRCCGFEDEMQYKIGKESREDNIKKINGYIKNGNSMEPLIGEFSKGEIVIKDGNHRYRALEKLGMKNYRIIIWTNSIEEYKECIDFISNSMKSL